MSASAAAAVAVAAIVRRVVVVVGWCLRGGAVKWWKKCDFACLSICFLQPEKWMLSCCLAFRN
uniref:Uncharacterized protein n=1 Tax=Arundo donax TaxID=35708 RepID=A0A0A9FGG7_ARUDO